MRFNLWVNMNNDAFREHPELELGRILRKVANLIEDSGDPASLSSTIHDYFGNSVGYYEVILSAGEKE